MPKFMMFWDFSKRIIGKQIYYGGHEHADVVEYRTEWAKRMMEYRKKIKEYEGDNMNVVIHLERLGIWDRRHIFVTHDECVFYANDTKNSMWLEVNEAIIRKKGQRGPLIVSEFHCPCHRRLKLEEDLAKELGLPVDAREIIKPGKNVYGYWKSEDMVKQLTEKDSLFSKHHILDARVRS